MVTTTAPYKFDPAYDILRAEHQPLDAIFRPRSVAVIGATERAGSVGRTLLWNLVSNPFGGTVFPVNPQRRSVLGIKAYPSIAAVPETVDLAVIVTPASTVPGVIQECLEVGVRGAIIISAGFKEIGVAGIELEHQILDLAKGKMRIIGPNCLGVMNPLTGLNATFASAMANPGSVGFISQSGALCTSVLDWSFRENVGFSAFVSIGSMLDVDWSDLIYYLGDDPHTSSIVIYMESIGNARSFLSAAREVALTKPIIVIKAGRTAAAAAAAASHTGALTGSDEVLDAAFRRCGVLRVNTINDLFNMAEVLAKQPRPQGKRLTILTNAGGPGVLATDHLISGGGELAPLSESLVEQLNAFLPPHWSHQNPIDILGDADADRYAQAIAVALANPESDALLAILTPQAMTDPTQTAQRLVESLQASTLPVKPILASWMGGDDVAAGEAILNRANIFTFPYPDTAAQVFNYMWQYAYSLRSLYETPVLPQIADPEATETAQQVVQAILERVRASGRILLTELESKQVLSAYGIPTVPTYLATSAEAAVERAEQLGYPVVLKLNSEVVTHKTDVGGVQLNLTSAEAVRQAYTTIAQNLERMGAAEAFQGVTVQPMVSLTGYELIVGSSLDPQFGPVLLFGTGGQLVEVFRDRALALPPLTTTLARRMMEQTLIYRALQGVRGRNAVDLAGLEQLLVCFSHLVSEQPWIKEIDINPLLAAPLPDENQPGERQDTEAHGHTGSGSSEQRPAGLLALDARIVIHAPDTAAHQLPKPAIRPYPSQYIGHWQLKQGLAVTIRPIRPEDEPLMVNFHKTLSEESVYLRYAHLIKLSQRVSHDRLTRICFIDYDRAIVLVADHKDPESGEHKILAVGRLSKLIGTRDAEFAMLVSDPYQRQGLGTELLRRLLQIAKDENRSAVLADILPDNYAMQRVCTKLGFKLHRRLDEPMLRAERIME
ncbi:bifunctional acetate--CoA ligase family protein/GNAT family N-acetyltransferase [Trichothermofontia sp.]